MMTGYGSDWGSAVSPITFDDGEILSLAESVWEIHHRIVRGAGFDLTDAASGQRRDAILGKISSVLYSSFTPVFGLTPQERYADVFEQVSYFAVHLAKGHIFADGNKRTTMQMSLGLLSTRGIVIDAPDPLSPKDNMVYCWIQDIVTGDRTQSELSEFLRSHAIVR